MERFDKDKYGGFNDYPPNWKPATDDEFWSKFCTYEWKQTEHRQMITRKEGGGMPKFDAARLFLYGDTTGLAFVYQVGGARYTTPKLYKFALCEHLQREGVPGKSARCYHVSRCVDCGHEFHVDSSD